MYNIYLKEKDLLDAEQFPVAALLNEAANSDIIEFVTNLVDGVGSGYNYSNCSFWNDFDEYEQANMQMFDGLWVGNEGGEEIIISYKDLLYYLETLFSRLVDENFNRIDDLRELIKAFKEKYC